MKILSSPGSGYLSVVSVGWPTTVLTKYISPTPRESCRKVATFFESGDQTTTGVSLRIQPASLVA